MPIKNTYITKHSQNKQSKYRKQKFLVHLPVHAVSVLCYKLQHYTRDLWCNRWQKKNQGRFSGHNDWSGLMAGYYDRHGTKCVK